MTTKIEISSDDKVKEPPPRIRIELRKRSCVKAIGWRGIGLGLTMSVSYLYLGDIKTASKIGIVDMGIKFIVHYVYERVWAHIKWGYK